MKPAKAIRLRHTCFTFAIMFAAPILSSHASVFARENLSFQISVALPKTSALGPEDGTDLPAPQKKALTVEDVVSMVKAGISDELVASRIRAENRAFDLSPEQIIRLKKEGVTDAIIKLMIEPKAEEKGGLASGVTGKYYDKQRPAEYLELNPDHTFYRSAGGGGITGTYQLNGNEITLNLQAMGTNMAFKGNVEGDRITMEEPGAFAGKVTTIYVRRNANSNVGSVGSKESAQPPVSPKASCADYNSCLKSGIQDHMASQWQQAITDLEEASKQSPTEAAPWGWLGRVYLALGRNQEAANMWDKTLNLGGPLVFQVCLERGGSKPCERGNLSLAPTEVSFTLPDRRNLFAAAPTEVRAMRRFTNSAHGFINLQVKQEKYLFEYSPDGGNCRIQSLVECPQKELDQQVAVRNYVLQTIPKLASAQVPQPAAVSSRPQPSGPLAAAPSPGRADAICSEYVACLKTGEVAVKSTDWGQALAYFQKASLLEPANPGAWTFRGTVYLATGRSEQASAMWDKALSLGGPLTFVVCHPRVGGNCQSDRSDRGNLSLGPKLVSYNTSTGQELFAVSPAEVTSAEVSRRLAPLVRNELHLKIKGKNYTFCFVPFGVDCGKEESAYCEEDQAVAQQLAVFNYISQAIPKLASGTLKPQATKP